MSQLMSIAIKYKKKGAMQVFESVQITKKYGVANDFRGKPGKRQVTVLSYHAWSKTCVELNSPLSWLTRRANLLVDELDLYQTTGKAIAIGKVRLLITGETDPCARMDESHPGLFNALLTNWRGGVCCQVVEEGEISINDTVEIIEYAG